MKIDFYNKYIVPVWKKYEIWGFILIAILLLGVLWYAQDVLGVNVGSYINNRLGL